MFRTDGTGQEGRFFQFDSLGQVRVRRDQHTTFVPPFTCPDPNFGMLLPGCQPSGGSGWTTDTTKTYVYDLGGNRTDNGGSYTGNRITGFNSCTYTSDADGNITSRAGGSCAAGAATFVWNGEGQLDSVQAGGQGIKYFYDAAGRLVFKRVNGTPNAFVLWDGQNPIADLSALATTKTTEYSSFPGMDSPHAFIWSGRTWYPHRDALGNVIVVNDSLGGPDRTYQYDDWGKLSGGADGFPFSGADKTRWKGALWYGNEANLYYMRNRWYDPETGRFLSEDPLGVDAGMNLYAYASNDPANGFDPSGLQVEDVVVWGKYSGIAPWLIDTWYRNQLGSALHGGPPGELARGRGFGPGSAAAKVDKAACAAAIGAAALSVALDWTGFSALRSGVRLFALGLGGRFGSAAIRRTIGGSLGGALAAYARVYGRRSMASAARSIGAGMAESGAVQFPTTLTSDALSGGNPALDSALNFIPIVGSGWALYGAYRACTTKVGQ